MSHAHGLARARTLIRMARVFTLSQARRSLPMIAAVVAVMQKRRRRIDELTAIAHSLSRTSGTDGGATALDDSNIQAEISKLQHQLGMLLEHVQGHGVEVKDVRRGLVDWRAERDGREVYLCWQPGERTVSWWHELSDGFAGRQPIIVSEWV